ncbi:uncharacterized protein LOC107615841 [Arachis ipaensis]|uniref:uncharacterized protein LOC107615841 n=1 Tax=Arachis ipaensis TaxID=130454 RepID=UPI0007AFCA1D|nr:uncharacterized protein LOC107615841 [Arachis ipaensis]
MMNKLALEAVDRTFQDLISLNAPSSCDIPFGGKVVVLGGDFRQVLPVIPKGTRAEIVMASINSLILWKYCSCGVQKEDEIIVDIPSDLLISPTDNPIQDIVSAIYSDIHVNHDNALYFQERVIVAPTVDIVQQINDFVVDTIPGLENITCSGIPKHVLKLKKGAPIILLRNIDQENGLCNGTRLIVQDLGDNIIGAEVVSESNVGDKVFIPRMNLVPSDPGNAFHVSQQFSNRPKKATRPLGSDHGGDEDLLSPIWYSI